MWNVIYIKKNVITAKSENIIAIPLFEISLY